MKTVPVKLISKSGIDWLIAKHECQKPFLARVRSNRMTLLGGKEFEEIPSHCEAIPCFQYCTKWKDAGELIEKYWDIFQEIIGEEDREMRHPMVLHLNKGSHFLYFIMRNFVIYQMTEEVTVPDWIECLEKDPLDFFGMEDDDEDDQ